MCLRWIAGTVTQVSRGRSSAAEAVSISRERERENPTKIVVYVFLLPGTQYAYCVLRSTVLANTHTHTHTHTPAWSGLISICSCHQIRDGNRNPRFSFCLPCLKLQTLLGNWLLNYSTTVAVVNFAIGPRKSQRLEDLRVYVPSFCNRGRPPTIFCETFSFFFEKALFPGP